MKHGRQVRPMFTVIVSVGDRVWGCAFSRCCGAVSAFHIQVQETTKPVQQGKARRDDEAKGISNTRAFAAHGLQLTRPLSLSLIHTHSHTPLLTLTHTFIHSLYIFFCLSLSLTHTHTFPPSISLSFLFITSFSLTNKRSGLRGLLTCEHEGVLLCTGSDHHQHQEKQ